MRRKTARRAGAAVIVAATAAAATAGAGVPGGPTTTPVAEANTKSAGYAPASRLSKELRQVAVAAGAMSLENPGGIVTHYGYDSDTINDQGQPVMVPAGSAYPTEATKTEPDKNTYLVFDKGLPGADPASSYGTHFLFQGHESGGRDASGDRVGAITRVNLDADSAHRITLLATTDSSGTNLPAFDGSTWDPWAQRLLFTSENGPAGGVWSADLAVPSTVTDVSGAMGRGGYEGIQNDSAGNVWIVEDSGGSKKQGPSGTTAAKRPNSFVYRFVPATPGDEQHGRLQALQVLRSDSTPITFESEAGLNNNDQVALHTYGRSFQTRWVTIHDTATDGTTPFDANAAAKAEHATPFKRPENGQFRPGSRFSEFYFDETGDTDLTSPENDAAGGWGSILKLTQSDPSSDSGALSMFYRGDEAHSGLDNVTFLSRDTVTFVEDAGDTLHAQRNALDSGFTWDVTRSYADGSNQPVRWLAEGRDASATIDSANGGFGKNDGDNEITGVHVSDGDPTPDGILGAKIPQLFSNPKWRWFYTQQHGDNSTYEVLVAGSS